MSEIYTNYANVIETQKKANKDIIDRISNYKKIANQENTTSIELEIEDIKYKKISEKKENEKDSFKKFKNNTDREKDEYKELNKSKYNIINNSLNIYRN